MKVRAAGLLDLSRIEELHRSAQSHPNESSVPAARLWSLLSSTLSALLPLAQETMLYVAEDGGKVLGFVQASGPPGALDLNRAKVLQVLNLQVTGGRESEDVAAALIEHLSNQALTRGVHRLFVRLPDRDPLLPVFRLRGFRQYATEQVLFAERVRRGITPTPEGARAMRRGDARRLYQLYRKVTPQHVSQLEAPTYREWRALHAERTERLTRRGSNKEEVAVDRVELVGWVKAERSAGAQPHTLSFMVLPERPLPDELADLGLGLLGDAKMPVWSSLRHYDSDMIDALRGRGFSVLLTQMLLVKELALRERVAEKGLVPSFG
jgi:GNAT superfamily N-acetyltransferase